jgi:hypothetical protein
MDFTYNQLMKHETGINDLQRLYPTMDRVLEDIADLKRFKDMYRGDILEGLAKSTVALDNLHVLRHDHDITADSLNKFIKTFNQWADIIKGLQTSVEELKKENLELRGKLGNTTSTNKSVSSTTATVGASVTTPKSILKK